VLISGLGGTRVKVGQTGWKWWIVETKDTISLQLIQLDLQSVGAETVQGVSVDVTAVATVKVRSTLTKTEHGDEEQVAGTQSGGKKPGDKLVLDKKQILRAGTQFGGKSPEEIKGMLKNCLEGHQRQILGTLTVEQIFKDRASFSTKVREHVTEDLERMGFEVVSYSIKNIQDAQGYMDSLGATQIASVKRDAEEGTARNKSEAMQKVAQAESVAKISAAKASREAHVSMNQQKEQELEADKALELKRAKTTLEVGEAMERSQAAINLVREQQQQQVIREKTQQRFIEREVETKIAEEEARRIQAEMEGQSLARLKMSENDAKAVIVKAKAEGERIRLLAAAEADAIRSKGLAEAENLRLKAQAYNEFGQAALAQLLINQLPAIAAEVAAPLSRTDKITFVSNGGGDGGGPSALTREVTNIMGQLPQSIQALTGFDLRAAIENAPNRKKSEIEL
jgi:flotillin